MKKLFENWRGHLDERGNPSERRFREAVVDFVVGQMQVMGMSPGESADRARIQKETHNIVDLAIKQLGLAQENLQINEAAYEPGRAVADINTGEDYMGSDDLEKESVQDLADKFGAKASIEQASDGKDVIIVRHRRGDVTVHNDSDEMYQELTSRSSMKEDMGREILIPGYGSMTVRQARRKLSRLIIAAAADAQKNPPVFRYLDDGVIQAIHQALKDNKEQ